MTFDTIRAHDGTVTLAPGVGLLGVWEERDPGTDDAARAAASFLRAHSGSSAAYATLRRVTFGVGIAMAGDTSGPSDERGLALRLATLAEPNTIWVGHGVYQPAVDRFDVCGVVLVVPRSDPLPGPVFCLLALKAPRSGTHHQGPDHVQLFGRREMLRILDRCRLEAARDHAIVLHLVGEPGSGKSKLLREWLAAGARSGQLHGWTHLEAHGVPYGEHPFRVWQDLARGLGMEPARPGTHEPTVIEVDRRLRAHGRPTLIVVYRPSFRAAAPAEPAYTHRHVALKELDRETMAALAHTLAAQARFELSPVLLDEIVTKARGNPLYAEEAASHVAEVGSFGQATAGGLPESFPELLAARARWTAERVLSQREHERRARAVSRFSWLAERDASLRKLDGLEEQLTSWLDRFDVIQGEAGPLVRRFLADLERLDGRLALMTLLFGRQRPHRHRLAQAIRRLPTGN